MTKYRSNDKRYWRRWVTAGPFAAAVVVALAGCAQQEVPMSDSDPASCADPVALDGQSRLRGGALGKACAWLGVRYAEPPVGELRLMPPKEYSLSGDTQSATRFGNDCTQNHGMFTEHTISEDCLFLNVWSPQLPAARRSTARSA